MTKSRIIKWIARILGLLVGALALFILAAMIVYPPQYVLRLLAWGESDAFDWQKFPERKLQPASTAAPFGQRPDERVPDLLAQLAETDDWDAFMQETETQAFIVIQDGDVLYEGYFNDTQPDSIVTSFSVAKSFTSALVGIAIDEGYIAGVNEPVTNYLPELAARDPRFEQITIRDLLMMASGLDYQAMRAFLFNSDDPLTTYYPDQRELSLENTRIIDPPGTYFSYNKYHPQLLGMLLERSTGISVTEYLQTRIWDRIGMQYGGSWSLDSQQSGFEKMESGVNARAIDFAKFGQLYLNDGRWNGVQVIPEAWVAESTVVDPATHNPAYYPDEFGQLIYNDGQGYYKYMWHGYFRGDDGYDFAAIGDRGQFIYISPHKNLVITRNGIDFGIPLFQWVALFYDFATEY